MKHQNSVQQRTAVRSARRPILSLLAAVPTAALLLAAPSAEAKSKPNLVPNFSVKTGVVGVSNLGPGHATKKTVITVHCFKPGGCPDPTPAQAAPYTSAAFPNKVVVKAPPLKAGKNYKHKINFFSSLVFPPGTYVFSVCVDAGKAVAETNELDNCKRFRKVVKGIRGPGRLTN